MPADDLDNTNEDLPLEVDSIDSNDPGNSTDSGLAILDTENVESLQDVEPVQDSELQPANEEELGIKQLDQVQEDLNEQLDQLADQIGNIVDLYVAARKKEAENLEQGSEQVSESIEVADAA